jgi:hypothetical protein
MRNHITILAIVIVIIVIVLGKVTVMDVKVAGSVEHWMARANIGCGHPDVVNRGRIVRRDGCG